MERQTKIERGTLHNGGEDIIDVKLYVVKKFVRSTALHFALHYFFVTTRVSM